MLARLGVWPLQDANCISPYRSMHIWEKGGMGNMRFDSEVLGGDHVGHIVDTLSLQQALRQQILSNEYITLVGPSDQYWFW